MRSGHFPPQRKKKNPFDICIVGLLLFCGEEVDVGLWFELESLFPVFSLLVKFLKGRERNGGGKRNFGVAVVGSEAEEVEEIFPGKHPIFPLSNTHTFASHSLRSGEGRKREKQVFASSLFGVSLFLSLNCFCRCRTKLALPCVGKRWKAFFLFSGPIFGGLQKLRGPKKEGRIIRGQTLMKETDLFRRWDYLRKLIAFEGKYLRVLSAK